MDSPPSSSSPWSSDVDDEYFDASKPLQGVVLCCTSIPANERTHLSSKVDELGGRHEYDLTPKTTHLIVGEYDTTKYRHVARSRPDIKPMALGWVDALRDRWVQDESIDFRALEKEWTLKTFETGGGALDKVGKLGLTDRLRCCVSGIEEDDRTRIIASIRAHGGDYTGNLDKSVTHLIVREPAGRKYLAAKKWGLHIVAPQWVHDSINRRMILDEACYDPHLPPGDIGNGAWVRRDTRRKSLGKRLRDAAEAQSEGGRRKLRKTASMKLNSQRENMWGQILGNQPSQPARGQDQSGAEAGAGASLQAEEATQPLPKDSMLRPPVEPASNAPEVLNSFTRVGNSDTVFASCCFYAFGFSPKHIESMLPHITSREGTIVSSLDELSASENISRRFVIVPQDADPRTHPLVPDGVQVITEFFIEKCIHRKSSALPDPNAHVLGRPFPIFPIASFDRISISTTGFVDLELNQVEKVVRQVGARYAERFTPECSMLICTSLGAARKQKIDLALMWAVPIVKADWLWECISQGKRVSTKDYYFAELIARVVEKAKLSKPLNRSRSVSDMNNAITPKSLTERTGASGRTSLPGSEMPTFDVTPLVTTEPPRRMSRGETSSKECHITSGFETAPTHQDNQKPVSRPIPSRPGSRSGSRPLAEKSANDLNKASFKDQNPPQPSRKPLARIRSEVADSEADEDDGIGFPVGDYNGVAPVITEAEDVIEPDKRRLEREEAERAATERQSLSNKLVSLLGRTTTSACNHRFDSAVANGGGDDRSRLAAGPPLPIPRRKRKLIGRVISNASAASNGSGSQESSTEISRTRSTVIHEEDSSDEEEPAGGPRATQLEYDDPEATKSKARLRDRMLGRNSLGSSGDKAEGKPGITMGAVHREQEALSGSGRSLRRR